MKANIVEVISIPDDVSLEERKKIIMQCIQDAKDIFEMLGGKLENDSQSNLLKSSPEPQFELGVIIHTH